MNQPSMSDDIHMSEWMINKVKNSSVYAQNLYACMCNNVFQRNAIIPILKNWTWCCSWRQAGGLVGEIRGGDYIDFYCSGMSYDDEHGPSGGYVMEGTTTNEIRQDLMTLGWVTVKET